MGSIDDFFNVDIRYFEDIVIIGKYPEMKFKQYHIHIHKKENTKRGRVFKFHWTDAPHYTYSHYICDTCGKYLCFGSKVLGRACEGCREVSS